MQGISVQPLATRSNLCNRGPPMKRDAGLVRAVDLVGVTAAAKMAGISRSFIYWLMSNDRLDYYEMGGRRLIHKRDVLGLIESRRKVS
jgi:excisionase family DNA binding protein